MEVWRTKNSIFDEKMEKNREKINKAAFQSVFWETSDVFYFEKKVKGLCKKVKGLLKFPLVNFKKVLTFLILIQDTNQQTIYLIKYVCQNFSYFLVM